MKDFSLREVILGLRNSYLDINDEYSKLKDDDNIFIEKKKIKKVYFYFGKDEYGKDNFICSVVDKLNPYDRGKKDIVFKSYSNDFMIIGDHNYRIEIMDSKKFNKIVNGIYNSEFMKNRPKTIKIKDKLLEISPSYIELKQEVDEKKERDLVVYDAKFEHNLKMRKLKYRPILTYKAVDDYLLTTDLYNQNYLDEIIINNRQLNKYYKKLIRESGDLSLSNPEVLLDGNSEYNIQKEESGYSLVLRPKESTHID